MRRSLLLRRTVLGLATLLVSACSQGPQETPSTAPRPPASASPAREPSATSAPTPSHADVDGVASECRGELRSGRYFVAATVRNTTPASTLDLEVRTRILVKGRDLTAERKPLKLQGLAPGDTKSFETSLEVPKHLTPADLACDLAITTTARPMAAAAPAARSPSVAVAPSLPVVTRRPRLRSLFSDDADFPRVSPLELEVRNLRLGKPAGVIVNHSQYLVNNVDLTYYFLDQRGARVGERSSHATTLVPGAAVPLTLNNDDLLGSSDVSPEGAAGIEVDIKDVDSYPLVPLASLQPVTGDAPVLIQATAVEVPKDATWSLIEKPHITFRAQNVGTRPVRHVRMLLRFYNAPAAQPTTGGFSNSDLVRDKQPRHVVAEWILDMPDDKLELHPLYTGLLARPQAHFSDDFKPGYIRTFEIEFTGEGPELWLGTSDTVEVLVTHVSYA